MLILGGTATNGIDQRLSERTGYRLLKVEHKVFHDGESYIRIPAKVEGEDVIVVQSTYPPQDKHLMELFLMVEALKDLKASRVVTVVPYLAYSRQDRRFRDGEAVSIKTVLNLLRYSGADSLVVVEPHKPEELHYFRGEVRVVDPMPVVAREVMRVVRDPLVVAPDRGALDRARRLASYLDAKYTYMEKERDRITGEVRVKELPRESVQGKEVVLVDDIVSTGSTMAMASKSLLSLGAKRVIGVVIHSLATGDVISKLREAGLEEFLCTNTVPSEAERIVDVSDQIVSKL